MGTEELRARYEQFYREYHDRVLGYVRNRISRQEDAEDIVADIFTKVYASLPGFDPQRARLSTWLYQVTRNTVIDYYRTNRSFAEVSESIAADDEIDSDLLSRETLQELGTALRELRPELRDIIVLHYYQHLPMTEIAQQLNMSYGVVKLRRREALGFLRERMGAAA